METLQWTLLVGLLGMVVYVLWHRMRASFGQGVAPPVAADWRGEGANWTNGVVHLSIEVKRPGMVKLTLGQQGKEDQVVHEGGLTVGLHEWELPWEDASAPVSARLVCTGHSTERRLAPQGLA